LPISSITIDLSRELVDRQGKCREHFLHEHAPGVLAELRGDLALVTVLFSCVYLAELVAFARNELPVHLLELCQTKPGMDFEYWCLQPIGAPRLIARGHQQIASMRRQGKEMVAVPLPQELRAALEPFRS